MDYNKNGEISNRNDIVDGSPYAMKVACAVKAHHKTIRYKMRIAWI